MNLYLDIFFCFVFLSFFFFYSALIQASELNHIFDSDADYNLSVNIKGLFHKPGQELDLFALILKVFFIVNLQE